MDETPPTCQWCGRPFTTAPGGRRRRYCRQSCRQRAYEQRRSLAGHVVPDDAVILDADQRRAAADRAFALRCACEDIATAIEERASYAELAAMAEALVALGRDAERLR